ncbi:ATP-binding protein [Salegentibacter sp. JZCK2]|uniref:AAA family ATPase n=1 Tax=Salegentibacter tibetensis TaxID=2873600 RepID=UPI001CCD57CB|nr:ATP-binding protein [Salegentibacter tibetensis]MBZ9729410.1 ATP-binding protein [Salegentibacter tibetensis]
MILSFKVENFRSIKDPLILDFTESNRIKEDHLPYNSFKEGKNSLLKSLILYGRNASGKSNVLMAFKALTYMIENSSDYKVDQSIDAYEPFRFDKKKSKESVNFSIDFIVPESKYRFNYTIKYLEKEISYESLHFYPEGVKSKLFIRNKGKINYGEYYKGSKKAIEDNLLNNQLFISKAASSKIKYLSEVYLFFTRYFYVSTIHDTEYDKTVIRAFSEMMLSDNKLRSNILKLLKAADTNIADFDISKNDSDNFKFPENIPDEIKENFIERYKYNVKTNHKLFDNDKEIGQEYLDLEEESFGTKKLLTIGSLIISTLEDGGVIVIDELDKGLHPLLSKMLIKLFHSKENNPKNAQLIFATHDSTLLDNDLFRRDQICFVDKEFEGGSILYKLSDIKGVRKDVPIDRWYLSGRYRAIPVLSELNLEL